MNKSFDERLKEVTSFMMLKSKKQLENEIKSLFLEMIDECASTPLKDEDGEIIEDRIQDAYLKQEIKTRAREMIK